MNRANTLDHYFDKNSYPEFTVYIPNLIHCCSECNSLKGSGLFDAEENRKFIHFYYDSLPTYKFLFFRFINTADNIVPSIMITLEFEHENKIIRNHFSLLKLHSKYREATNEKLSAIMIEIINLFNTGHNENDIRGLLEIRYNSIKESCGSNYWEACIYDGVLNSKNFINNLSNYP